MTTTLELDADLVRKIAQESDETSDNAAVEAALRFAVQMRAQMGIRDLFGKVEWEGNLEESRRTRFPDWDNG